MRMFRSSPSADIARMGNRQQLCRIGGILYLTIIAIGIFDEFFVKGRVKAANVRAMESLWRLGIASHMVLLICALVLLFVLFVLLRAVNEPLMWLAVFFNLVSITSEVVATTRLIEALFSPPLAAIRAYNYGYGISLIFFAGFCVVIGYVIRKSGFFPRWIGGLMQLAGVCYFANSFALLVAPNLASYALMLPAFIGELSFTLWLLFKGAYQ